MKTPTLAGVRVLDLGDESVRLTTRILADLGADVILVEPPAGSRARHLAPFLDGVPTLQATERSLVHQLLPIPPSLMSRDACLCSS